MLKGVEVVACIGLKRKGAVTVQMPVISTWPRVVFWLAEFVIGLISEIEKRQDDIEAYRSFNSTVVSSACLVPCIS